MSEQTFGRWLRHARTTHTPRISQESLAELTGIERSYLSRIENDKVGLPLFETRQRIHRALGTTDDDLRAFGVRLRDDFQVLPPIEFNPNLGEPLAEFALHEEQEHAYDENAPLTPEEEAVLSRLTFMGYSQLSNAQLREIIRIVTKGQ